MVTPIEIIVFCCLSLATWLLANRWSQAAVGAGDDMVAKPHRIRSLPVRRQDDAARSLLQRFDDWFHRIVVLTTSSRTTRQTTWIIVGCAAVMGTAVFVATDSIGPTVAAAVVGLLGGLCVLAWSYRRMVQKFQKQLPQAMELMARAVRAGESLEQAVTLVSQSLEDPLRTEFRRCVSQVEMGLPVRAAMGSLAGRIDTLDVRIFGSTIAVHRETGGNLAQTLERLSEVIRKRYEYHQKLRSTTGAGRISVMIIAMLGALIFGYMFLFRPEYGQELWTDATGRKMLIVAFVSEMIGLIWVQMLLRADY